MQLTKQQLYNYIKEHGITKAELTEDFNPSRFAVIPKGTILYFGTRLEYLTTIDGYTNSKNIMFKDKFCYDWDRTWNSYKGKFKIIPEYTPDKSKIITKIKSLTAKINKIEDERNKLIEML